MPSGLGSLHRYPGTSCLATISLSRDKSQFSRRRDSHVRATALPNRLDRLALSVRWRAAAPRMRFVSGLNTGNFGMASYFPVVNIGALWGPFTKRKKSYVKLHTTARKESAMPLIVLHRNGNKHEGTLDEDVKNMGTRYGNVTHVLQSENLNYQFPSPGQEQVIHILSHGGADYVCDMSASTFNSWMVKAFKMNLNKALNQTYFIYSLCCERLYQLAFWPRRACGKIAI